MPNYPEMTSNPARRKQVRRTVLECLKHASPYALANEVLQEHCNDLIRPPINYGEWGMTEKFLKDGGFIVPIQSDIDPEMKQWAITDLGKTFLKSL